VKFSGREIDLGRFNVADAAIGRCVAEISNNRGKGGEYRILVEWLSDEEVSKESRP
jgi:hypothetical protein